MKCAALLVLLIATFGESAKTRQSDVPHGCEDVTCPTECGDFAYNLPHPFECDSFCKCVQGVAESVTCPYGLQFNIELELCDFPHRVKCVIEPHPNGGCDLVSCPSENTGNAIHLPDPTDCGSFCKCDWGMPIHFTCPDGLHFNAQLQVCDWPASANCDASIIIPTTQAQESTAVTTPGNGGDITGTAGPNGCEVVRCPVENGEFALHFPNPSDCGSFCKCDWGQAIYFKCPEGLHFNSVLEVCDWPENAKCDGPTVAPGITTSELTQTTPKSTPTSGTGGESTVTEGPSGCEYVRCPAENGEILLVLPNPFDCGSYCVCDMGNAIYRKCPDGLHFNPVLKKCDWPENANCDGPTAAPGTTTSVTTPSTSELTETTPKSTPTSGSGGDVTGTAGPNGCEYVRCPAENGEFALHLPNPTDCGSFCKCDWGQAIYFKCPDGLHFNPVLEVCDWPQNAKCDGPTVNPIISTSEAPSQTKPIPTKITTTTLEGGGNEPESIGCEYVRCPAENGKVALHLPNPSDCESFCKCDWGSAHYFKCPAGLHFNPSKQVCDWATAANCRISVNNSY